jgi:hypothetical protein
MAVFAECPDENGAHIDAVCAALPSVPREQVLSWVDFLHDEGLIYSTIDENHYKWTDIED